MTRIRYLVSGYLVLAIFAAPAAVAQAEATEFPPVLPGYRIEFPRDEGSHPAFRTEWWYVTGWVEDEAGQERGFQVTFFRSRPAPSVEENPSKFAPRQLLFAHAALSDPAIGHLLHEQRSARAGFGLAEAREGGMDIFIDDWSLRARGSDYAATVDSEDFALTLQFHPTRAPLLQGDDGFSRKGSRLEFASDYYSLPQLQVQGILRVALRTVRVTGHAWLDHEWSSSLLEPQALGWDWTGINFTDGGALMAFRIRGADAPRWTASKWCAAAGSDSSPQGCTTPPVSWVARRQWRSPRTGVLYPVEWTLQIGARTLWIRPLMDDQESDSRRSTGTIYWEGAVTMEEGGKTVGKGYLELTGYGSRLRIEGQ